MLSRKDVGVFGTDTTMFNVVNRFLYCCSSGEFLRLNSKKGLAVVLIR